MKIAYVAALALTLSGCGGNLLLVADGKTHPGKFDSMTKSIELTVDGKRFAGNYVTNSTVTTGGGMVGNKWISTTGTTGGTQGRAMLISSDNSTMKCEFAYQGMSAQGVCQDSNGKTYDFMTTQ